MPSFLDYIDRAKLVDSQTVFVFSVGGLDGAYDIYKNDFSACGLVDALSKKVRAHFYQK